MSMQTKFGMQQLIPDMYREAQIRGKCCYPDTHLATPSLHPNWYIHQGMTCLRAHQVLLSCLQCGPVTKIHKTLTHHGPYPHYLRVGPHYTG